LTKLGETICMVGTHVGGTGNGVKDGRSEDSMPEFKPRVVLKPRSRGEMPISEEKLTTGEPDAGDPHVRFGGRGGAHAPFLPLSYRLRRNCVKPPLAHKNFAKAGSSV
jgi:hypothetical protein